MLDQINEIIEITLQSKGENTTSLKINPSSHLNNYSLDSIDMMDIAFKVEERFDIKIEDPSSIHTVNDIIQLVEQQNISAK